VPDGTPPPLPVSTVIGKVEPSPLVKVIVFNDTDAVVNTPINCDPSPIYVPNDAVDVAFELTCPLNVASVEPRLSQSVELLPIL